MARKTGMQKSQGQLIKAITKCATKGAAKFRAMGETYLGQYHANISVEDLQSKSPAEQAAVALHHLKCGERRKPKETIVRVFNPTLKKHGWHTNFTAIQIISTDKPFLLDSVVAELNRLSVPVRLAVHPVIHTIRKKDGTIEDVLKSASKGKSQAESFINIEVNSQSAKGISDITKHLTAVLTEVSLAVEDWQKMRHHLIDVVKDLESAKTKTNNEAAEEACEFLRWLHDNHFTLLGYREYDFTGKGTKARVKIVQKTALGILRDQSRVVFKEIRELASMPQRVRNFVSSPDLLVANKTDTLSKVHRAVHMDSIGIKKFDKQGRVIGQRVFVGLYTAGVYTNSASDVPLLRRKIQRTFARSGFSGVSHDGKALLNILETYPRDELFQVSEDKLLEISMGVLHLQDRQKISIFVRHDDFERFVSCLIYIPRDSYTTDLRLLMQHILETTFNGTVATHYAQLGDQALARLHVIVATTPGSIPAYDIDELENKLREEARTWGDRLGVALTEKYGEAEGHRLLETYRNAFDAGYRQRFSAADSLDDIEHIESVYREGNIALNLNMADQDASEGASSHIQLRFKAYHPSAPLALSGVLPILEHFGLNVIEELPHRVHPKDAPHWISLHDFGLEPKGELPEKMVLVQEKFHTAFDKVWSGEMESDALNALILFAGLDWREVTVLRALTKYLRQTAISFSETYMAQTLVSNPRIAKGIAEIFKTKFEYAATKGAVDKAAAKAARIRKRLVDMLDDVESADQDRILRRFLNLTDAALRTNFYQQTPQGKAKEYLSIKFSSRDIEELPLPRPRFEIFVYSPRLEGVHLRFGNVARGGLRWSDRREDFRTEILGLVKAQQVKNAVIVPVGSKGGFVVKRPPSEGGRDAFMAEGIECYKIFIRGLLDLTDNFDTRGRVVPPKDVLRHDPDDPYLVVAADKGTATFSDIANSVSLDYGFWLGDAFASGGSKGYDHKKMGITARGGWESVKRHFREMNIDTQTQDFTVVGVGDMSGDVFGNGMLLSKHIRLVGAFNHMHIFIDPDPDAASTFKERKRLFNLPRSSWTDFNAKLISKGGGIFDRKSKWITLTPQIKKLLQTTQDRLTPNELMQMLLLLDADMLWFGGIGTYVKSSTEGHVDAGDRTNDAIRIDGAQLRVKVVGEGANLGMTQRARIEAALGGVRINTDSVDNSAGVDCSDHEVNIKILLDTLVANKKLNDNGRNSVLEKMTDEVGLLVLRDNYLQTQALSIIQSRGVDLVDHQIRLMRGLEKADRLNRTVEFLPDDETLSERAMVGHGLSRPEISVLLSYSKIWVFDELLESKLPDDPYLERDLVNYFPTALRKKYFKAICGHRLRREIIASCVTNSMINRVGGTFVTQLHEKTGMGAADIAAAFTIARESFSLRGLWTEIEALDNKVPAQVQISMLHDINRLLERTTIWLLRNGDLGAVEQSVSGFLGELSKLAKGLNTAIPAYYREDLEKRAKVYTGDGVPKPLALAISGLVNMSSGFDIVRLAQSNKLDVAKVAKLYFQVGARFRLGRLRAACEGLEGQNHWQKLAVAALIEDLFKLQANITHQVLIASKGNCVPNVAIPQWADAHKSSVERTDQLLAELRAGDINDISMIAVASQSLRALAEEGPSEARHKKKDNKKTSKKKPAKKKPAKKRNKKTSKR